MKAGKVLQKQAEKLLHTYHLDSLTEIFSPLIIKCCLSKSLALSSWL